MARYSGWTGLDMSQFDPDVPLKHVKTNAGQTMVDLFSKMDPNKEWTPRDIAEFIGIGGTGPTIVGSPTTVADELTRWMTETGVAGFNLAHAVQYQDIADFIELVVPELQRRGTMWSEYEGSTFREKLYGQGAVRLRDDHPGRRFAAPAAATAALTPPSSVLPALPCVGTRREQPKGHPMQTTELHDIADRPAYRTRRTGTHHRTQQDLARPRRGRRVRGPAHQRRAGRRRR